MKELELAINQRLLPHPHTAAAIILSAAQRSADWKRRAEGVDKLEQLKHVPLLFRAAVNPIDMLALPIDRHTQLQIVRGWAVCPIADAQESCAYQVVVVAM